MTELNPEFDQAALDDLAGACADLDRRFPEEGFGCLDHHDRLRNSPVLLEIVERAEQCTRCPGARACRGAIGGPKWSVPGKVWIEIPVDVPVVRIAWTRCRPARVLVQTSNKIGDESEAPHHFPARGAPQSPPPPDDDPPW